MPVDKFGHTDSGSGSMQRVVAGGVTLTQVNNTFVRLDGTNAFVGNLNMGGNSIENLSMTYTPAEDNDLTTKKYADEQDATKVSKTGDIMTGNLILNVDVDRIRTMGCRDLRGNRQFTLLLGSTTNKMLCQLNVPITLQTTDGLRVRIHDEVAIDIVKTSHDPFARINVFKDIYMNGARITGLAEPTSGGNAVTKNYVDQSLRKKCLVGYIPNLEANNSMTGFIANASSSGVGHEAYRAFNNLVSGDSWFSSDEDPTLWLGIKCPEPVLIWRVALKVRMAMDGWNLSASNDGTPFEVLFSSTSALQKEFVYFFDISTTTAYQYYRLTAIDNDYPNTDWSNNGIQLMQLYVYNT
jgi:hypothetical protein